MARPKGFDPAVALERAATVFWENGYAATSVQDLVDRMGINRFSLYDTFGDKRALYLAALDHYQRKRGERLIRVLEETPDGLAAIRAYFDCLQQELDAETRCKGCFAQNATLELAQTDSEVAARIRAFHLGQEKAVYNALKRARAAGQLDARRGLRDLARFLYAAAQGLVVMGQSGHDHGGVAGIVRFIESAFDPRNGSSPAL